MKVKKISNGKYRVYYSWNGRTEREVRFAKKMDAKDFIIREGGYLCWEDFESEADAQRFLEEKEHDVIYW